MFNYILASGKDAVPSETSSVRKSDDESLLSSQNTTFNTLTPSEQQTLRKYRIRRLRKLVDKTALHDIYFTKYYADISSRLAKSPWLVTNDEIEELRVECIQSLGSDYEHSESSSSDSSHEVFLKKKKKIQKYKLTPSEYSLDPTNPYNQAFQQQHREKLVQQQFYPHHQQTLRQTSPVFGGAASFSSVNVPQSLDSSTSLYGGGNTSFSQETSGQFSDVSFGNVGRNTHNIGGGSARNISVSLSRGGSSRNIGGAVHYRSGGEMGNVESSSSFNAGCHSSGHISGMHLGGGAMRSNAVDKMGGEQTVPYVASVSGENLRETQQTPTQISSPHLSSTGTSLVGDQAEDFLMERCTTSTPILSEKLDAEKNIPHEEVAESVDGMNNGNGTGLNDKNINQNGGVASSTANAQIKLENGVAPPQPKAKEVVPTPTPESEAARAFPDPPQLPVSQSEWELLINKPPMGERYLPISYVKTLKKPPELDWYKFATICNRQFKTKQDKALKKRQQQIEAEAVKLENERKMKEQKEKEEQAAAEAARLAAEKEEKERKERERIEREKEEQRQKALAAKIKQEKEDEAAKKAAELAANLPFVVDLDNYDVKPTFPIPQIDPKIAENVKDIGELIADPDVLFCLQHLKTIGSSIRAQKEREVELQEKSGRHRNLFDCMSPGQHGNSTIDGVAALVKKEPGEPNPFHSPPSRLFTGLKRHTQESFTDSYGSTSKRRRTSSSTPSRAVPGVSPASTPNREASSIEACKAVAETKSKCAETGEAFIRKKKMTPANNVKLFEAVKAHKRDSIDYNEGVDSFYKIMTYYAEAWYGMVPEDVRHLKLKENLFNFVMKNSEYTQVNNYNLFLNLCNL